MDCQELVELVTDYLEGTLSAARTDEMLEHLRECVDCLRYLGQIQLTSQLLAQLDRPVRPSGRAPWA